jgi:acetyl-CoA acetyltransferase
VNVVIAGTGTSKFGIFVDARLRGLAGDAVHGAVSDSGLSPEEIGLVVVGNAAAGLLNGQEMIRAQTTLAASPLAGRPTFEVENACASSSSAFHIACLAVESGMYEAVAVVGAEKMSGEDRTLAAKALATAVDIEAIIDAQADESAAPRPVFMEIYAANARAYMKRSGATAADFAAVVAKSSRNGAANPIAQSHLVLTIEDVLSAREIVAPLTRPMCAGISDGAAALILVSGEVARRRGIHGPRVRASVVASGGPQRHGDLVSSTSALAYEQAGVGPREFEVVELHDAAAPAELMISEELGLAEPGKGPQLLRDGVSEIGGRCAINPSGGLLSRGHPIGATGAAQLVELADQLRGRAGVRQSGQPRLALAENAGGHIAGGGAACVITVLSAN